MIGNDWPRKIPSSKSQTKKGPPVPISYYEERQLTNDIERQIEQVRAELAKLETDRIRGLIDQEVAKTQAEEFEYFYGWNIEGICWID